MNLFRNLLFKIKYFLTTIANKFSRFYTLENVIIVSAALIIASAFFIYKGFTSKRVLTQQEYIAQNTPKEETITGSPFAPASTNKKVFIDAIPAESFSTIEINNLSRYLYSAYPAPQAIYSVKKYKVRYSSLDENNKKITIHAQFYVPEVEAEESFPIYVFGQGTTGLGDICAVSKEQPRIDNWGDYQTHMLSYAAQGYIVMFPDYEGFNDPNRIHHYFNAMLEAHVLLDGARATFEVLKLEEFKAKPKEAIFFAGYSQGGHAAFAVSDYAATYAPELPVKGVIGDGPTTDMEALLRENPILSPYVAFAYSDFYGADRFDPAAILLPSVVNNLEGIVLTTCIGKISRYYSSNPRNIFNDKFYDALFNRTLERDFPEIKKMFDENDTGLKKSSIPGLILQGTTDPIVTLKSQKEFMAQSCAAGNSITYYEYPGVHHYQTRQVSVRDTLNWMKSITEGKTPDNYCTKL